MQLLMKILIAEDLIVYQDALQTLQELQGCQGSIENHSILEIASNICVRRLCFEHGGRVPAVLPEHDNQGEEHRAILAQTAPGGHLRASKDTCHVVVSAVVLQAANEPITDADEMKPLTSGPCHLTGNTDAYCSHTCVGKFHTLLSEEHCSSLQRSKDACKSTLSMIQTRAPR